MSNHDERRTAREGTANSTAALPVYPSDKPETSAATSAEVADREADELPSGSAVVVVRRGPNAGSRFRLHKPVTTAGRHPGSDIYLDDITASRRHAEFRADDGDYRIVDISSLNGTYVNHKAVDSAVLANGDEIQIGNSCLVFLTKPTANGAHA